MIITDRLILRKHIEYDIEWLSKLYSNEKAMYYIPYMLNYDVESVKKELLELINEEKLEDRMRYFYCIELKNTHECIGEIGFTIAYENNEKIADIGYFTFPEYWRNGYVTEAMNAIIKFAFNKCNILRMSATCYIENIGSEKIMQKSKMKIISNSVHKKVHNGIEKDRIRYEITKQSYDNE